MVLAFFLAYLVWVIGSGIIKNYFFTAKVEKKNGFYWSTAIIALLLLFYLSFQTFIAFYFGYFYEMTFYQQRLYGNFFFVINGLEFITLLLITGGLKKSIRDRPNFQVIVPTSVFIYLFTLFLFQPISFNWLTGRTVIPGWHTTILPAYEMVRIIYLFFFLIIIGFLHLIYSKIKRF